MVQMHGLFQHVYSITISHRLTTAYFTLSSEYPCIFMASTISVIDVALAVLSLLSRTNFRIYGMPIDGNVLETPDPCYLHSNYPSQTLQTSDPLISTKSHAYAPLRVVQIALDAVQIVTSHFVQVKNRVDVISTDSHSALKLSRRADHSHIAINSRWQTQSYTNISLS